MAEGDATEADLKLLSEMDNATSSGEPKGEEAGANVQVKKEKKSAAEMAADDHQEFCDKAREHHALFSKMQVDIGELDAQLARLKYTDELRTALKKHASRVTSVVKVLLRACTEKPKSSEYPKLKTAMSHVNMSQAEFVRMAASFGVQVAKPKRRKVEKPEE